MNNNNNNGKNTKKPHELTESEVARLNDELISSQFITSDKMYIELQLLKDFNIGKCLYMILNSDYDKEKQNYIWDYFQRQLEKYNSRVIDTVINYLPKDSFTQTDFDNIDTTDQTVTDTIYSLSPLTFFHKSLFGNLTVNINHTVANSHFKKNYLSKTEYTVSNYDILFYINTYPYTFSDSVINDIATFITERYEVNTIIMNTDPSKIDIKLLNEVDEYYPYLVHRLLDNNDFNSLVSNLQLSSKRMYAPYLFPVDKKDYYIEELKKNRKLKEYIQASISLCIEFEFLKNKTYVPLIENGEPVDYKPPIEPAKVYHNQEELQKELDQLCQKIMKRTR